MPKVINNSGNNFDLSFGVSKYPDSMSASFSWSWYGQELTLERDNSTDAKATTTAQGSVLSADTMRFRVNADILGDNDLIVVKDSPLAHDVFLLQSYEMVNPHTADIIVKVHYMDFIIANQDKFHGILPIKDETRPGPLPSYAPKITEFDRHTNLDFSFFVRLSKSIRDDLSDDKALSPADQWLKQFGLPVDFLGGFTDKAFDFLGEFNRIFNDGGWIDGKDHEAQDGLDSQYVTIDGKVLPLEYGSHTIFRTITDQDVWFPGQEPVKIIVQNMLEVMLQAKSWNNLVGVLALAVGAALELMWEIWDTIIGTVQITQRPLLVDFSNLYTWTMDTWVSFTPATDGGNVNSDAYNGIFKDFKYLNGAELMRPLVDNPIQGFDDSASIYYPVTFTVGAFQATFNGKYIRNNQGSSLHTIPALSSHDTQKIVLKHPSDLYPEPLYSEMPPLPVPMPDIPYVDMYFNNKGYFDNLGWYQLKGLMNSVLNGFVPYLDEKLQEVEKPRWFSNEDALEKLIATGEIDNHMLAQDAQTIMNTINERRDQNSTATFNQKQMIVSPANALLAQKMGVHKNTLVPDMSTAQAPMMPQSTPGAMPLNQFGRVSAQTQMEGSRAGDAVSYNLPDLTSEDRFDMILGAAEQQGYDHSRLMDEAGAMASADFERYRTDRNIAVYYSIMGKDSPIGPRNVAKAAASKALGGVNIENLAFMNYAASDLYRQAVTTNGGVAANPLYMFGFGDVLFMTVYAGNNKGGTFSKATEDRDRFIKASRIENSQKLKYVPTVIEALFKNIVGEKGHGTVQYLNVWYDEPTKGWAPTGLWDTAAGILLSGVTFDHIRW
jgi:hypothetical protein